MKIAIDRKGTTDGLKKLVDELLKDAATQSILILSCDANNFTPQEIDPILEAIHVPVFGGVFPSIIHEESRLEKGTVAMALPIKAQIFTLPNISSSETNFEAALDDKIKKIYHARTIFTFVDGLSKSINSLIEALFNFFGLEVNYIGGGAGSLSFEQKPCLFTPDGMVQDAALIALTNLQSSIAVNHGWQPISGPYRVTASEQNTVKELDHEPAFHVYKKIIDQHSNTPIDETNFFDIAKGFPLGISKLGNEHIVRDLVVLNADNTMTAVGEVPIGSYVHILSGNAEKLLKAAGAASKTAIDAFPSSQAMENLIFIDCISRVLFLGEEFDKELTAVKPDQIPMIGALTLGEIANNGKAYLEFYNKTSVVGVMGE